MVPVKRRRSAARLCGMLVGCTSVDSSPFIERLGTYQPIRKSWRVKFYPGIPSEWFRTAHVDKILEKLIKLSLFQKSLLSMESIFGNALDAFEPAQWLDHLESVFGFYPLGS